MEFNEKMQELRKRKGLTQEELAEALFVSRTAISKWESGRGYPNIDSLKAIAKYFGVTIDELLSGDELLTLAQEDTREKEQHTLDLVFGLLDVSMVLLLFLPLFGQRADGAVRAVPLPALGGIRTYLLAAYWLVTAGTTALGVITLALQNCRHLGPGKAAALPPGRRCGAAPVHREPAALCGRFDLCIPDDQGADAAQTAVTRSVSPV